MEWTELRENKLYTELYTIGCDLVLRLVVPVAIILFTGVKWDRKKVPFKL